VPQLTVPPNTANIKTGVLKLGGRGGAVFELDVVGSGQETGSGICEINTEEC